MRVRQRHLIGSQPYRWKRRALRFQNRSFGMRSAYATTEHLRVFLQHVRAVRGSM